MNHEFLIILILVAFSGLFSASESAFFSINVNRIKLNKTNKDKDYINIIINLLNEKERLLSTILIGNLLVNIFYFSYTSQIIFTAGRSSPLKSSIMVFGFFITILLFGEILPKTIAVNMPFKIAKYSSFIIIILFRLLYPVSIILRYILLKTRKFTDTIFPADEDLSEEELNYILEFAQKDGFISLKEKFMLFGSVDFDQLSVKTFMTPRTKISACTSDISREDFISLYKENKHSKIIVYKQEIEDLAGYVNVKDIFFSKEFDLSNNIKRIFYIPELAPLRKTYSIFNKYGLKIAAVVDEYGGFQGIITNEDIIEAITGDIDDELKRKPSPLVKLSGSKYMAQGDLSIRYFNMIFSKLPKSENVDTLAGYLESVLGRIPQKGDVLTVGKIRFVVKDVNRIRIKRISIELL